MEKEMNLNVDSFKDALEEKKNIPDEYIVDTVENVGQSKEETE